MTHIVILNKNEPSLDASGWNTGPAVVPWSIYTQNMSQLQMNAERKKDKARQKRQSSNKSKIVYCLC